MIEEDETWDFDRIQRDYWIRGIFEDSASNIKALYDMLDEGRKNLEKDIKEDEQSEEPRVLAGLHRKYEELKDLRSKIKIVKKRLSYFKDQQKRLDNTKFELSRFQDQAQVIYKEIEAKTQEFKELIEKFRSLKGNAEILINRWRFANWDQTDKSDDACSWLLLNDPKDFLKKMVDELLR